MSYQYQCSLSINPNISTSQAWTNRISRVVAMKEWCYINISDHWYFDTLSYSFYFEYEKEYNWFLLRWS